MRDATDKAPPLGVCYDGGTIKSLGAGRVEGLLVPFGSPKAGEHDRSSWKDWFHPGTEFGFDAGETITTPLFIDHGLGRHGSGRIGRATLEHRDSGVWLAGQIKTDTAAGRLALAEVEAGHAQLSSGTARHLVRREPVGGTHRIDRWILGSDASVTSAALGAPAADPRAEVHAIKSLIAAGLESGPSEEEDFRAAASAVRGLADLWGRLAASRASEGRAIGRAKLDHMKTLRAELDGLIAAGTPRDDRRRVLALRAKLLELTN